MLNQDDSQATSERQIRVRILKFLKDWADANNDPEIPRDRIERDLNLSPQVVRRHLEHLSKEDMELVEVRESEWGNHVYHKVKITGLGSEFLEIGAEQFLDKYARKVIQQVFGDVIDVGDMTNVHNVAIGRGASASSYTESDTFDDVMHMYAAIKQSAPDDIARAIMATLLHNRAISPELRQFLEQSADK